MQKNFTSEIRNGFLFGLAILGLMTAFVVIPSQYHSEAFTQGGNGLVEVTSSHQDGIENYDVRTDGSKEASAALSDFRQQNGTDAVRVADIKDKFVSGENSLLSRVPTAKVEYSIELRSPESISTSVNGKREFLSRASSGSRVATLRNFIKENNDLIGTTDPQTDQLKVASDYTNPNGDLSYTILGQTINDIPVFQGEIKAGFTKNGEMFRVINNLAPGLNYDSLSNNFGDPADAVKLAAGYINHELKSDELTANAGASDNLKTVFGTGDWATTAEKMYFPTEPGVARPAWRILIWQPTNAFYILVDAETGKMLWRKNLSDDQTQSATFNVYANSASMVDVAENPTPITPGPTNPNTGTQGAQINRENRTLIGNEAPNTFNNLGWITDNTNITDGNAVQAGLDIDGVNGVDAPVTGTNRVFSFAYNPPPGLPPPPDDLTTTNSRNGAVTQLFYINNRYHDLTYQLGFTEAARNFQNDNFGRGGLAADRVSAEAQDSSGTNNANFAAGADGTRGRMQMYRFTQTPARDGDLDADVVIHEHTHGLSNRLIGNNSGLTNNRGGSMGEGWSDFYGLSFLSQASDPINAIYTTGSYVTLNVIGIGTTNSYYGIRRFPYAVRAFTGGPNNLPFNPLTFADLNTGCVLSDGAYPASPPFAGNACNEVHNAGEVWAISLWEVRAKFITRLGFDAGNRKVLQLVTDGMKLTPNSPTFIQARNAIISAAAASSAAPEASADVADVREGFRIRGMGFSATDNGTTAVEAFDTPNAAVVDPFSVSDPAPGGDGDGYPEPGETVQLSVAVTNPNTGATINNVVASVVGGGSANYGNIADGQTVTRSIPFTIPANAACGSIFTVTINVTSDAGTQVPQTKSFRLGAPVGGAPATFSNNTLINLPAGQPTTTSGPASPYPSNITVSGLTGNKTIRVEFTGITHTFPGDLDFLLVGPGGQKFIIMSDSGGTGDVNNLTFTLSDAAAAAQSTTQWVAGDFKPYNDATGDTFVSPAPAAPYSNPAPAGTDTFASVFGTSGAAMNGTWSLYAVDDAATDAGSMAGWKITFEANDFVCSITPPAAPNKRADFDGDGKTDFSVFRPSNGNWYINRSTAGMTAVNFGVSGDSIVPGDYDGDGKTDVAVYRNGYWYYLRSSDNAYNYVSFGNAGDVLVPRDYDGDNKTDLAVFRPGNNTWYWLQSSNLQLVGIPFGQSGDVPVAGDFDGDGKADLTVYRSGTWVTRKSSGGSTFTSFGLSSDTVVPADYDGDGKDDIAVFRNSTSTWYILRSSNGVSNGYNFGASGDVPVPGDYDGDGKYDIGVFRNGIWYVIGSTSGSISTTFGTTGDRAVPKAYIP